MGVMDLENMSIPDNKGGRPPKSGNEEDFKLREAEGDPFTMAHESSFWEAKWKKEFDENDNTIRESIANISEETYCLPRTVVNCLQDEGIHDFNETLDEYPEAEEYIDGVKEEPDPTPSKESSKNSPSSGLRSLIDN